MSHFYLTLPSNSSTKFYPNNTLAHFTTKLRQAISLHEDWEVGLAEISFPKNWYNVGKHQSISVTCANCFVFPDGNTTRRVDLNGSAGYFPSVTRLITHLNDILLLTIYSAPWSQKRSNSKLQNTEPPNRKPPEFTYNAITNKVALVIPANTKVEISKDLRQILGFSDRDRLHNKKSVSLTYTAENNADIVGGRHALYVYCDLLKAIPVGDTSLPLLRIVDASGATDSSVITRRYANPLYVPLQKKQFGSLEIDIKDSLGEKIPFEGGSVIVTLHFRKCRTST